MPNGTDHQGGCPVPFLDESTFPGGGGNVGSRLYWIYRPTLKRCFTAGGAISTVGLACSVFLLTSWAVLPPEKTKRHSFGVCLTCGILCICLAFIIGTGAKPQQCFDEITPNDMYSSLTCAFSGAFVVAGAITASIWVCMRAVTMHLQVCWDITPGNRFFYCTQALGWAVAIVLFIVNMTVTGVSYRFGPTCHINSHHALRNYWAPLSVFTGSAAFLTLSTLFYCLYIFLWSRTRASESSADCSLDTVSFGRSATIRVAYRRITKALWLNWRSLAIISSVLLDIAFYAAVYMKLDHVISAAMRGTPEGVKRVGPYILCLVVYQGDRSRCYTQAGQALVTERTAEAILLLLSIAGIQCFALSVRTDMFTAWIDLYRLHMRPDLMPKDTSGQDVETQTTFHSRKPSIVETCDIETQRRSFLETLTELKQDSDDTLNPPPWAVPVAPERAGHMGHEPKRMVLKRVVPHADRTKGVVVLSENPSPAPQGSGQTNETVSEVHEGAAVTVTSVPQENVARPYSEVQHKHTPYLRLWSNSI